MMIKKSKTRQWGFFSTFLSICTTAIDSTLITNMLFILNCIPINLIELFLFLFITLLCFFFLIFFSQNSTSHSSSSEIDEGPAAKLARFTNDLIAENHQRKSLNSNQSKRKPIEAASIPTNLSDDDVSFKPICKRYQMKIKILFSIKLNYRMIADIQAILIIL